MSRWCMSRADYLANSTRGVVKQVAENLFIIFHATSIKIAWWCNTSFDELDQMLNSFSLVIITFSLLHTTSALVGVEWSNKLARKSSLSLGQPACKKEQFTFKKRFKKPFFVRWTKQNRLRSEICTCSFSTFSFLMLVPVRSRTVSFGQRFCREKRLWYEFMVIPFLNLCQEGLLRCRHFGTTVTWSHTSSLYYKEHV